MAPLYSYYWRKYMAKQKKRRVADYSTEEMVALCGKRSIASTLTILSHFRGLL